MSKNKDTTVALPKYDPNASLAHAGDFNITKMIVDYAPVALKRAEKELTDLDNRRIILINEMDRLKRLLEAVK